MVSVRDAINGKIQSGDFIFTRSYGSQNPEGYNERLIIKRIDYRGAEGLAVDFTIVTTDGREWQPNQVVRFGYFDRCKGFTFDMPVDRK